ncbi:hypothetical protein FKM82_020228 [Ascaphus truei]
MCITLPAWLRGSFQLMLVLVPLRMHDLSQGAGWALVYDGRQHSLTYDIQRSSYISRNRSLAYVLYMASLAAPHLGPLGRY